MFRLDGAHDNVCRCSFRMLAVVEGKGVVRGWGQSESSVRYQDGGRDGHCAALGPCHAEWMDQTWELDQVEELGKSCGVVRGCLSVVVAEG